MLQLVEPRGMQVSSFINTVGGVRKVFIESNDFDCHITFGSNMLKTLIYGRLRNGGWLGPARFCWASRTDVANRKRMVVKINHVEASNSFVAFTQKQLGLDVAVQPSLGARFNSPGGICHLKGCMTLWHKGGMAGRTGCQRNQTYRDNWTKPASKSLKHADTRLWSCLLVSHGYLSYKKLSNSYVHCQMEIRTSVEQSCLQTQFTNPTLPRQKRPLRFLNSPQLWWS